MFENEQIDWAVSEALVQVASGILNPRRLLEADDQLTKAQVEKIVRKTLKDELGDSVLKVIRKELKSDDFEKAVNKVTMQALENLFQVLYTRRSTWQNALKK